MDLHRHDQFSTFDGFGKPSELAKLAKEKEYTWLGISNHGTTAGNIQHYFACKEYGIKPVLGVECYHEPVFDKEKKNRKSFHLCLYAKRLIGYQNINRIMTLAENNKYYTARVTFELLEKYHEGIICTSACVAGYASQAIINKEDKKAIKWLKKMQSIFGADFYVEIQPYKISEAGLQEKVNVKLIEIADKLDIKCILTSDSHRGAKEDLDTYMIMHKIAKHDSIDIEATYSERYMPERNDMFKRFITMHSQAQFEVMDTKRRGKEFMKNLMSLGDKVEDNILDGLTKTLPVFDENMNEQQGKKKLISEVRKGLKRIGKQGNKIYIQRVKHEIDVISNQGYSDYFLIVQDFMNYARENGIIVGYGRGSVCNCLVAYCLWITEIDSIKHGLDFNRFMRHGKKKDPDIDIDAEPSRRDEIIQYIIKKYGSRGAQVSSYGLYKGANTLVDLFKVCGVEDERIKKEIKYALNKFCLQEGELIPVEDLNEELRDKLDSYNAYYNNIVKHFYLMYEKLRYYGVHAAGVAVTADEINKYIALRKDKNGNFVCVSDMVDLGNIGVLKFDVLGLKTLSIIKDLRKETGEKGFNEKWCDDPKVIEAFNKGNTPGVFQFDASACQDIMRKIDANCFNDVIAVNAMNRPGSLKLKMPDVYADHKINQDDLKEKPYWDYVSETYGCIIYQEQVLAIAINIGGFTPDEADILVKMEKGASSRTKRVLEEKYYSDFKEKFVSNARSVGLSEEEAVDLFDSCAQYGFNKGHSTGYAIQAIEEAYYLVYYPAEYFYAKIKYALNEAEQERFCAKAFVNGVVVFIPHINYSMSKTCMRMYEGEKIIQKGLSTIKGVGSKAGDYIVSVRKEGGRFKNIDDFIGRCQSKNCNKRVIALLEENGCCDIKHTAYMNRIKKYNATLWMKGGGSYMEGNTNG